MAETNKKQHYVQKAVLKKFSNPIGNQNCITILNLKQKKIYDKNIDDVFFEDWFYNLENCDNALIIENGLKEKIEDPMSDIINRLEQCCYTEFTITRQELETIKKYILVQLYRNKRNQQCYGNETDKWKHEILYILQTPFDELLKPNNQFLDILDFVLEMHCSFMMIVRTMGEFCINDMGYATENVFGFDNYIFFPFSPHYALLQVSLEWKQYKLYGGEPPIYSPILLKYLELPRTCYVNRAKMFKNEDIWTHRDKNDEYTYKIVDISSDDTRFLNTLTLNETLNIIGVHDANALSNSIIEFQNRAMCGGAKQNYDWFEDALKAYHENKDKKHKK